ncbi:PilW family protein [Xanthomonas graminis]|uniref:Type IV pilus assembly protein PilW n=1 Tax=Xanthomonas graminis pv. phlei TaxID=487906 RepID=A0A0K2ZFQ3_9XANT|nr:type IV pilus assembly protein PilW [Xanthomonas translucens pv. phlei]
MKPFFLRTSPSRQSGFNLVELMISMLLGLLVVGAAVGIFLSNRKTYAATEGLSRVQESARIAFEMMARDIREAGGNPCDSGLPVANLLSDPTSEWWKNWAQPLQGFDNSSPPGITSKSGTDAIQILSASNGGATVTAHNAGSQTLTLNAAAADLHANAVMLLCDRQQVAVLQADGVSGTSVTYKSGALNACNRLGRLPGVCAAGSNNYTYEMNSLLTELRAVRWYVADNPRGTSLYQSVLGPGGKVSANEITEGVSNLQFEYLVTENGGYVEGAAVTNWANVVAVKITMTVNSGDAVSSDNTPLSREFTTIVSIRNRNS